MNNLAKAHFVSELPAQKKPDADSHDHRRTRAKWTVKVRDKEASAIKRKPLALMPEDIEIVNMLHSLRQDLDYLHNRYDQITDPMLVDSIIYELKAVNIKYVYYLNLCKQKGIISC